MLGNKMQKKKQAPSDQTTFDIDSLSLHCDRFFYQKQISYLACYQLFPISHLTNSNNIHIINNIVMFYYYVMEVM